MTKLVSQLREPAADPHPNSPRLVTYDKVRLTDGSVASRKKVILMTGGCSVPTCTMCPFTNENNFGSDRREHEVLDQAQAAIERTSREPDYSVLALYNDGSFFAPSELSESAQVSIARMVAESGVSRLLVESLPHFVTDRRLAAVVEALGPTRLEVGMGLQSADDMVREVLVNTRVTKSSFERAIELMDQHGVEPKVYLMIKPPFLEDGEAVADIEASARYLADLGVRAVTLCPTRVSRNTVAWELWRAGLYKPPNLWTVVEATRRARQMLAVRIATLNIRSTDFEAVTSTSCPSCQDRIVDQLEIFSTTGDLGDLPEPCDCQPQLDVRMLDHASVLSRAQHSLARVSAGP